MMNKFKESEYQLFHDYYTEPIRRKLSSIIHAGIASDSWLPLTPRPSEVRPYIYETLLYLVSVHAELSATINPHSLPPPPKGGTTEKVLQRLLIGISEAFRDAFQQRQTYPLPALMQATLDVEFVAQTLSQYPSDEAGEIQGKIYEDLDRKTTREASQSLQNELPAMRAALKRLREGTKGEFLCFKKQVKKPPGEAGVR